MDGIMSIWSYSSGTAKNETFQATNCLSGFHFSKSSSLRFVSKEKKGQQSIGRSKGGLTTKIHGIVASTIDTLAFMLSP